jgi:hypothetical protein
MVEESNTLPPSESHKTTFRERESVEISLNISTDTLELLKEIAAKRGLSVESVLKFFIGKGLRELDPESVKKLAVKRFKSRKDIDEENPEIDLAA